LLETQAANASLFNGFLMTLVAIITLMTFITVYLLQTARSQNEPDTSGVSLAPSGD
jgi:hypothetical protein